jgi:hypothetical protein
MVMDPRKMTQTILNRNLKTVRRIEWKNLHGMGMGIYILPFVGNVKIYGLFIAIKYLFKSYFSLILQGQSHEIF